MVTGASANIQSAQQRTKQFNVTDLTPSQKRRLFANCFAQGGFVGFDKKRIGDQTYYVFAYKN
jgi:hypothetical protein